MDLLILSSSGALSGLVARLRQSGVSVTVADSPEMVLAATRRHAPDAVVVELLDRQSPGARILEDLARQLPLIFRIGLARTETLDGILVGGTSAQRMLSWNENVRGMISAVEDMRRVRSRLPDAAGRSFLGRIELLPVTAWALAELRGLSGQTEPQGLVNVLRQDPVLACQVLRWGLSMDPGLSGSFRPIHGAVKLLGVSQVQQALLKLDWPVPVDPDFDMESFCRRAVQVADLAVALEMHAPSAQAYMVGLLESVGRAAMALELHSANQGNLEQASYQRRTFGFDVPQLGAGLLEVWGFPSAWISAIAGACEPAKPQGEDGRLCSAVYVASSLIAGRPIDLQWVRAQGVDVDPEAWEALRAKSVNRAQSPRPQTEEAAQAAEALPPKVQQVGVGKHTPASMTLMVGLARTLVAMDPGRFAATANQLELIPKVAAELAHEQDVFVVSAVLMALLHDLEVPRQDQRGLFQTLAKGGAKSAGTALSSCLGPQPTGREVDRALHLLRALMEERAQGAGLGRSRERVLEANEYPYAISDVLMGMPTPDEVDRTPLWALQEGMVVGEDVLDEDGRLLARAGQRLSDRVVNTIQRQACMEGVFVEAV
ncbi:MAG: HD-like signal output (HDOD) protein [Cognaticolwellia sp.]|jgi:HD-like signal output (HDOD) protein